MAGFGRLSGFSICLVRPSRLLGRVFAAFAACAALLAACDGVLAETPQSNAHYIYARSVPCRYAASAACRRRPKARSPAAAQKPANDVAITEFGPGWVRLEGNIASLRLEVHDSTIAAAAATGVA